MLVVNCMYHADNAQDISTYKIKSISTWSAPKHLSKCDESGAKVWHDYIEDQKELDDCYTLCSHSDHVDLDTGVLIIHTIETLEQLATMIPFSRVVRVSPEYSGECGFHKWNTWALEITGKRGETKEKLIWRGHGPRKNKAYKGHKSLYPYLLDKPLKRERQTL